MGLTAQNIEDRQGRITASAFAKIREGGIDCKKEINRISKERQGIRVENNFTNSAMQHGIQNEQNVINEFKKQVNDKIEGNTELFTADIVIRGVTCLVGATPDGLLPDGSAVEIKSPKKIENYNAYIGIFKNMDDIENGKYGLEKYGSWYFWQVAFQVFVLRNYHNSDLRKAYLVFGSPDDTEKLSAFELEITDEHFEEIRRVLVSAENKIKSDSGGGNS